MYKTDKPHTLIDGRVRIKSRERWNQIHKVHKNNTWYDVVKTYKTHKLFISSYGRIKRVSVIGDEDILYGSIAIKNKNGKKYRVIGISYNKNGKTKSETFPVHQLVAYAFLDKPDWATIPDHIDNDGTNNNVKNLRWTNKVGNAKYAIEQNSWNMNKGNDNPNAILTHEIVHDIICPLLSEGYDASYICNVLYELGHNCSNDMIWSIRKRKNWEDASKDYTFPSSKKYSDDIIESICKLLIKFISIDYIINDLNLELYDTYENIRKYINRIANKERRNNISDKYFKKPINVT